MLSSNSGNDNSNLVQKTLEWIADAGINGLWILQPAKELAEDHLKSAGTPEKAIDSIIAWRTAYAAGTGFITGLGGIATMPVSIPAGLAASYALGANTAAAIAYLRGYDISSDQVKTFVLLCLLGKSGEAALKQAGVAVGSKVATNFINQIPGKVLNEINKKTVPRLITKAGETGVINLMKCVPLVGGVVGGSFDSFFVNSCGQVAKKLFPPISGTKR
ncbi:MAG: EcsC family protein [Elainella sp.]